jgi:hypothetical protein
VQPDPTSPLRPETPPILRPEYASLQRRTYTLRYEDDAVGVAKRIEFEAETPASALEIAGGEAEGRRALLLQNGQPLCRLTKAFPGEAPYWILAGAASASKP